MRAGLTSFHKPIFAVGLFTLLVGVGLHLRLRGAGAANPRGLVAQYAAAAKAGDLQALRELGVGPRIDTEADVLGQAWRDKVEVVLTRAFVDGARQAQAAEKRFKTELLPAAEKEFWEGKHFRDHERGRWILEKAFIGLTDDEQRFLSVQALDTDVKQPSVFCDAGTIIPADEREPDGPVRTPALCVLSTWTELQQLFGRAFARLPAKERQRTDPVAFAARLAAVRAPAALQALLLEAGGQSLADADRALATPLMLASLRDGPLFRAENGERLLKDLYKAAWQDGIVDLVVKTPATEGRLFRSGIAVVRANRSYGVLNASFVQAGGAWRMTGAQDLDVTGTANALCAPPPPAAPAPPDRAAAEGLVVDEGARDAGDDDVPPAMLAIDERCEWDAVDARALAWTAPVTEHSKESDVDHAWTASLMALAAGTLLAVMLLLTRRRTLDAAKLDLEDGEQVLDIVERRGRFVRGRATLTTRRVVLQQLHWWLASTRTTMIALARVEAISLGWGMVAVWVALGLALFPVFAPAGVLVTMYALVASSVRLVFAAGGRRYVFGLSGNDDDARAGVRFTRQAMRQQLLLSHGKGGTSDIMDPDPVTRGFLPGSAWLVVLVCLLLAAAQRVIAHGVDLEAGPWLGLLLALPALVGAALGGVAGALTGAFGALGTFAMLHPVPALGWGSIGDNAPWPVVVGVVAVAAVAGAAAFVGRGSNGARLLRAVLGAVVVGALLLALPAVAGAVVAGTPDWTAQVVTALGCLLLATGLGTPAVEPPQVDDELDAPTPASVVELAPIPAVWPQVELAPPPPPSTTPEEAAQAGEDAFDPAGAPPPPLAFPAAPAADEAPTASPPTAEADVAALPSTTAEPEDSPATAAAVAAVPAAIATPEPPDEPVDAVDAVATAPAPTEPPPPPPDEAIDDAFVAAPEPPPPPPDEAIDAGLGEPRPTVVVAAPAPAAIAAPPPPPPDEAIDDAFVAAPEPTAPTAIAAPPPPPPDEAVDAGFVAAPEPTAPTAIAAPSPPPPEDAVEAVDAGPELTTPVTTPPPPPPEDAVDTVDAGFGEPRPTVVVAAPAPVPPPPPPPPPPDEAVDAGFGGPRPTVVTGEPPRSLDVASAEAFADQPTVVVNVPGPGQASVAPPGFAAAPTLVSQPPPPPSGLDVASPAPVDAAVDPAARQQAQDEATYAEFLQTRASIGDPTPMDRDLFFAQLKKTRDDIFAKHRIRDVGFKVYVKDGRATLRAVVQRPAGPTG
jgi:hypothetical protein